MQRDRVLRHAFRLAAVLMAAALSACGGGTHRAVVSTQGAGSYAAPGPAGDPWGSYIRQASARFDVPERWIRAVIRQESGGREYKNGRPVTSDAGAMGLMQLMPATYGELAERYGLGPDPYEPHDNIMAGTGYIKELYGRYGSPAFLAAYDAGPHRLDVYLQGRGSLPNETVNYLASAAPALGSEHPMSGPLAAFADVAGARPPRPRPHAFARASISRCWQDPNAAYDPDAPCRAAPPVQVAEALPPAPAAPTQAAFQVAAIPPPIPYGSSRPAVAVLPAPAPFSSARRAPGAGSPYQFARNFLIPSATAATIQPAMASGRWAVQVGAFATPEMARRTAESVRTLAPRQLGSARTSIGTTAPFGGQVLYRARLAGLSADTASAACVVLQTRAQACVLVPPGA